MHDHRKPEPEDVSLPLIGRAPRVPVRKADDSAEWREKVGKSIERTRTLAQLTLKQFATLIGREERQVARWISGADRPQFDAIFAVPVLRGYLVIAIAAMADEQVEVRTVITVKGAA